MISYLMTSIYLIAGVLVVCGILSNNFGAGSMKSKGSGFISAGTTIIVLYLIFNTVYYSGYDFRGIPFAGVINKYGSIKEYMKNSPAAFSYEVAQLFTLTTAITLFSKVIPTSVGGSGLDGKILYKTILVIAALIANHYIICSIENKPLFKYLVSFINVFIAGGTLAITPIMLLGKIVTAITGLQADNKFVIYLVEKLPETEIGKIIKSSFGSSLIMLFGLLTMENVYGSTGVAMNSFAEMLQTCGPIIILLIGILMALSWIKDLLS